MKPIIIPIILALVLLLFGVYVNFSELPPAIVVDTPERWDAQWDDARFVDFWELAVSDHRKPLNPFNAVMRIERTGSQPEVSCEALDLCQFDGFIHVRAGRNLLMSEGVIYSGVVSMPTPKREKRGG